MAFTLSRLTHCLPRVALFAACGLALLLSSCTTSKPTVKGVPSDLPNIAVYGQARTPSHTMSRADYPFDSSGNYVTAWAAEGRSSAGPSDYRSSSHYDDDASPAPSRKTKPSVSSSPPKRTTTTSSSDSGSSSTARKGSVASSPPKKKPTGSSSSGSGSSSSTASSTPAKKKTTSSGGGGGGGSKHVVKSSDSLWSLAKKYGTSVEKIKAANGLKNTNIRDGATLTIPK